MVFHVSFIVNPKNGRPAAMISKEIYEIVRDNAEALDSAIIYNRDFNYNLWVDLFLARDVNKDIYLIF